MISALEDMISLVDSAANDTSFYLDRATASRTRMAPSFRVQSRMEPY